MPVAHHNQAVAVRNRVPHVMSDHERCQMVVIDNAVGGCKNLGCGLRIERRGVLVQKEHLRLLHGCH